MGGREIAGNVVCNGHVSFFSGDKVTDLRINWQTRGGGDRGMDGREIVGKCCF